MLIVPAFVWNVLKSIPICDWPIREMPWVNPEDHSNVVGFPFF